MTPGLPPPSGHPPSSGPGPEGGRPADAHGLTRDARGGEPPASPGSGPADGGPADGGPAGGSPAGGGPRSPWQLALACNRLALQGFGGVLAVAQHELVDRRAWLSQQAFVELLALAQLLPGPNVINVCILFGERHFGVRGVLAALAGMLAMPLLLAIGVVGLVQGWLHEPRVAQALQGMGIAAAGLLLGTCWKLAQPLRRSPLGRVLPPALAAAAFLLVGLLRWPLAPTLLGLVALGMLLAMRGGR